MLVILVLISAVGLHTEGPMSEAQCEAAVAFAIGQPSPAELGFCVTEGDHPQPTFAMKRDDKGA